MMRSALLIGLAAAALGACGSEDAKIAEYRAQKSQECLASLSADAASKALDAERFCGCVLDRQMAGRSASELDKLEPTAEQKQEWGVQCADASLRPTIVKPARTTPPEPAKGGKEAAAEAPAKE